jgi:hypothetical protein
MQQQIPHLVQNDKNLYDLKVLAAHEVCDL